MLDIFNPWQILYYSGDEIKKIDMRGFVTRMAKKEMYKKISWGNLKERDHLEDVDIEKRIILK
jgi:hypothetical protein